MKILFLTRALTYGGAERQLVTLAKGLRRRGHEVTVAVLYEGGALESELCDAGVSLHLLHKTSRWDTIGFLLRLVRFVKSEKPDIIHGYLAFQNILTVVLRLVYPGMHIVWGIRNSDLPPERDKLETLLHRAEGSLSRFADLIIVNSTAGMRDCIERGFPKKRVISIPNGIDTDRFRPEKAAGAKLRVVCGVQPHEKLVGLVGRLDPMKDHPTFLKAAALVAQRRSDLRFMCVGDGPTNYREELVALAKSLHLSEQLIWLESRDDMIAVYNALDVVVSASSLEGFSNVIAEAMACGTPCVVTDVGDSARIVGAMGEVVPLKDPHALATAVENTLSRISADCYQEEELRHTIAERFSVSRLITSTEVSLVRLAQDC